MSQTTLGRIKGPNKADSCNCDSAYMRFYCDACKYSYCKNCSAKCNQCEVFEYTLCPKHNIIINCCAPDDLLCINCVCGKIADLEICYCYDCKRFLNNQCDDHDVDCEINTIISDGILDFEDISNEFITSSGEVLTIHNEETDSKTVLNLLIDKLYPDLKDLLTDCFENVMNN
jgi:hypothetical protein